MDFEEWCFIYIFAGISIWATSKGQVQGHSYFTLRKEYGWNHILLDSEHYWGRDVLGIQPQHDIDALWVTLKIQGQSYFLPSEKRAYVTVDHQ